MEIFKKLPEPLGLAVFIAVAVIAALGFGMFRAFGG